MLITDSSVLFSPGTLDVGSNPLFHQAASDVSSSGRKGLGFPAPFPCKFHSFCAREGVPGSAGVTGRTAPRCDWLPAHLLTDVFPSVGAGPPSSVDGSQSLQFPRTFRVTRRWRWVQFVPGVVTGQRGEAQRSGFI